MTRRLMSRRGNSASQPQVTPYQQIELDDGWREWENTKQELVLVKRQVAEKDALIIQLKTASRRLQETLRKKDKDLQAAFAILRSPQDAKTTKTRKQELIDRLVSECMQRAATCEALAEERRRELDRLKYSSKFLRFQELEIEIEECHTEIDRLRAKLETTAASSPVIAGKLKVSAMPLTANGAGGLSKKTKLDPLNLDSPDRRPTVNSPDNLSGVRTNPIHSASGQVRVVPLAKYSHREGFVSKTRRRALEAEYYKQVRLAQLEVECELEENLHIRAAREAKRLEAIEQRDLEIEYRAESKEATGDIMLGSSDSMKSLGTAYAKEVEPSKYRDDSTPGSPEQANEKEAKCTDESEQKIVSLSPRSNVDARAEELPQSGAVENGGSEEPVVIQPANTEDINTSVKPEDKHQEPVQQASSELKQQTYEYDDFEASGEDTKETGPDDIKHSVWNVDPTPQHDDAKTARTDLDQPTDANINGNGSTTPRVWDADPIPLATIEAEFEGGSERLVWNADPHLVDSVASMDEDSTVKSDNEDDVRENDVHDVDHEKEDSVLSEEKNTSNAWNLDPSPSVPADEKLTDAVPSSPVEVQSGHGSTQEDGNEEADITDETRERNVWNLDPTPPPQEDQENASITDDTGERKVWNLEPTPSSDPVHAIAATTEGTANDEMERPIWNLDPEPAPILDSHPAIQIEEENASANVNNGVDSNPPDSIAPTDRIVEKENGQSAWNLDPTNSASPAPDAITNAPNHDNIDNEDGTSNAWNLDPSTPATDPEYNDAPGGEDEDERTVWNLDPHTGDGNEPNNSATDVDQDDENSAISNAHDGEEDPSALLAETQSPPHVGELSDAQETAAVDDTADPDGDVAEAPVSSERSSYQNSAREFEDDDPMDDATPEYTPPSTARNSDAEGDEEDEVTW